MSLEIIEKNYKRVEAAMDLWRLKIFCRVVEQRSFSKAAAGLRLSQPTVSSHIKDLEALRLPVDRSGGQGHYADPCRRVAPPAGIGSAGPLRDA